MPTPPSVRSVKIGSEERGGWTTERPRREGDGPPRHHRLDLGGNRKVNSVLHIIHVTQARCHPDAQAYLIRRAEENKTKRAARRAHKRPLANVIIRRMWNDADDLARANSTPSTAAA